MKSPVEKSVAGELGKACLKGTNLLAMGVNPTYVPKMTFDRWYEDRLEQLGLTEKEAIARFAAHGIKKYMVTTLLKHPRKARVEHLKAIRDVLSLERNWFPELVEPFGFGLAGIYPYEFNALLAEQGYALGLVQNVAA